MNENKKAICKVNCIHLKYDSDILFMVLEVVSECTEFFHLVVTL